MKFYTIAAVLLLAANLDATAIVVFRTPTRIVVASDSMQQNTEGQRKQVCKVRQVSRWWLTMAGFSGGTAPPLDVWALVTGAIASAQTLDDVGAAIEREVYPRMAARLAQARTLKGFSQLFDEGGWVSQIVVAGGDLTVGVFGIRLEQRDPFRVAPIWVVCPGRLCPDGSLYFAASVKGPSVGFVTAPRPPWVERADSVAAHRIIAEQIRATPADVSPPIDVVEIAARGARWVQRDPSSTCHPVTKG